MSKRNKTRIERYSEKKKNAVVYPVSVLTINFHCDENLAYVIRAASCFGASDVYVLGSLPSYSELKRMSGSTQDLVNIRQFSTTREFIEFAEANDIELVAAELTENAVKLQNFEFNRGKKTCIIVGNETTGIPADICLKSKEVYIPMPGKAFCLNVAQAANIMLYEYASQMERI